MTRNRGTGSRLTTVLGAVGLASLTTAVVLGLSLPRTQEQHEYSRLIAIHPPIAWAAYLAFGVTGLASILYLWPRTRARQWDLIAGASTEVGAVFMALTLITGSIWGRPTWGVWWVWDARLTLTALLLVLSLGYLALRRVPAPYEQRAKRSAISALLMVVVVPIDHFAVDWWRTLHQDSSIEAAKTNLDGAFLFAMFMGFVAMTLIYVWLVIHRYRLEQLEERLETEGLELALAERRAEAFATEAS